MQISLLLQTLILPLLLSLLALRLTADRPRWQASGLLLAWLPAAFWILSLPGFPPAEAVDWLWLAGVIFTGALFLPGHGRPAALFLAFVFVLLPISRPLLEYAFSPALAGELIVLCAAAAALILPRGGAPAPAIVIAMGATALAVCSALAGSLLIAQLAGALAAAIGAIAISELVRRLRGSPMSTASLLPSALLYLLLLAIARLYAELPLAASLLLLLAPLSPRLPRRGAPALAFVLLAAALLQVLLSQDSGGYY